MARLGEEGQSTVEFVVVVSALLVVASALSAFGDVFSGGMLVEHALSSASHHIQSSALGAVGDVFLY